MSHFKPELPATELSAQQIVKMEEFLFFATVDLEKLQSEEALLSKHIMALQRKRAKLDSSRTGERNSLTKRLRRLRTDRQETSRLVVDKSRVVRTFTNELHKAPNHLLSNALATRFITEDKDTAVARQEANAAYRCYEPTPVRDFNLEVLAISSAMEMTLLGLDRLDPKSSDYEQSLKNIADEIEGLLNKLNMLDYDSLPSKTQDLLDNLAVARFETAQRDGFTNPIDNTALIQSMRVPVLTESTALAHNAPSRSKVDLLVQQFEVLSMRSQAPTGTTSPSNKYPTNKP